MWLMLQHDEPRDYVIATGIGHSVLDLCRIAFARAGLDPADHLVDDPTLYRHAEVNNLRGDASLARTELGWAPTIDFQTLIEMMVDADLERLRQFADGRQGLPFVKIARKDLGPDLPEDLLVDRTGGGVGQEDLHGRVIWTYCICSI